MNKPITNRYEFVYLFDVENGNPNGDPDAGNMPRIDPESGHGLVTDVCLKRKIRNYVLLKNNNQSPYEIYVKEKAILNDVHERAHQAIGVQVTTDKDGDAADKNLKKGRKGEKEDVEKARLWMCQNFYDVRTFGAVMSTGVNCGQVRGPVQINFARSVDMIFPNEISITRMAVATQKEAENQKGDNHTMGRKHIVPYGLYRAEGYVSAKMAENTSFVDKDLDLLWESLTNMFEHDRSASRGKMVARKLFVFKHDSSLGNAPAHTLFDKIKIARKNTTATPPRSFDEYLITIDGNMPKGVGLIEKI